MTGDREYVISGIRRLKGRTFKALLGKGDSGHTVLVAGKANYVWVRVKYGSSLGAPVQALNRNVPPIHGRVVRVKEIDRAGIKGYEVIDFDDTGTPYYHDDTSAVVLPKHGWTHECSQDTEGNDPVNLYTRCWVELRVEPTDPCSMYAYVTHGWYMCEIPQWFAGGNSPLFVGPAAGTSRYDLVYIDCSGTVGIVQGDNNMPALGGPLPEPPDFTIPLAAILFTGTAGCIQEDMILDCRVMPNLKYPPGGARFDDSITPSIIYPDITTWAGVEDYPSRTDHRHGITCDAPQGILAQDIATTEGVATSFARSDHVHGLDVGVPSDVGTGDTEGASTEFVRKDHVHRGVRSLSEAGQAQLFGNITLSEGVNVTLTQVGQDIQIASTGGGGTGTCAPIDYPYLGFGTDPTLAAEVDYYLFYGRNLIKNSPGQITGSAGEPQWWDDVANTTLTWVGTDVEGIPQKHKIAYKLVTVADDVYGYQTFTFADEDLLEAGTTVVSLSCWVYCANANKASVGIYGTNLGLWESSQAGAGVWTLLKVEGITLNAADTSINVRLIVDTGTAYFTMPMLNVGPKALPWRPRGERYVPMARVTQLDLNPTGNVAWTSTDCTAATHNLAVGIHVVLYVSEPNGSAGSSVAVEHASALVGAPAGAMYAIIMVPTVSTPATSTARIMCNDSQSIQYRIEEVDADSDMRARIFISGYWRWE